MDINNKILTKKKLLSVYSNYPTGVSVVTASHQTSSLAITVSSLCIISFSPAIVSWSLDNNNRKYKEFCGFKYHAIHILNSKQANLALDFAKDDRHIDKITSKAKLIKHDNFWLLDDYHLQLKCSLLETKVVGDHTLIFLKIIAADQKKTKPLLYFQRKFHHL